MSIKLINFSCFVSLLCFVLLSPYPVVMATEYSGPKYLVPKLSSDGKIMYNAIPAVVYQADPNPPPKQARIPARFDMTALTESATSASTFTINYIPNGGTDLWSEPCYTFPEEAKAAFNAAAAIWGNLLNSAVPITINACWANLGSSSTLGYSGGGSMYRNFTNAPLPNTWYSSSLANALAGSDLDATKYDMHITYNSNFTWYYGIDGATPSGQYDLMSVVLHEIAHGLNFSGTMSYSGGSGSWGSSTGYPNIYDTFMRDGTANPGNQLINTSVYPNPSTALGTALTSQNIWFHGANAMAANGGLRVKMYAPATWAGGSSYSHLDYSTFSGTANRLMVYAISSGVSTHDPGPVTMGLFQDLGWTTSSNPAVTTTDPVNGATGVALDSTIRATFSKTMNAGTINTTNFYLNNGVTGTVSYDAGTYTATFTPSANLALNTTYTATITTGVTDSGGHPMLANKTWSFTTTDGSTRLDYNSTDVPKTIVDLSTVNSTLTVPAGACTNITDINVSMNATHTYVGDLSVTLSHSGSGRSVQLFSRSCSSNDNLVALFDDEAPTAISCPPNGTYQPYSPLSAFDGVDAVGTWTLSVTDNAAADTGTLNSWGISVACPPSSHQLNVFFPGAGSGHVTINPGNISFNTPYIGQFSDGAVLTLTGAAYDYSDFTNFTGNCATNPCTLTMNGDKTVNANFALDTIHKTRIGASNYFGTLPVAYASPVGTTIKAWGTYFAEPLTCNLVKNVTIDGGWNDGYSAKSGFTTLLGPLTISQGSLTVEELAIK